MTHRQDEERVEVGLHLYEIEGRGLYWEASDERDRRGTYQGTYETPAEVCAAFGGRLAWVYSYAAWEAWSLDHPEGPDPGEEDGPAGVLCYVRRPEEVLA